MAADNTISLQLKVQDDGSVVMEKFQVNAQEAFKKVETASQSLLTKMKSNWVELAAAGMGAWITISKAWNLAEMAAGYMEQKQALNNLAAHYGTTSDSIISSIQDVTNHQVAMVDIVNTSAKGLMMGLKPTHLIEFAQIATQTTNAMGGTVADAFEKMTIGSALEKEKMLKSIGIRADLKLAEERYALSIDKTVAELADEDRAMIDANAVMKAAEKQLGRLGESGESVDDKMEQLTVQMKDLQLAVGGFIIKGGFALVGVFNGAAAAALYLVSGVYGIIAALAGLTDKLGLTKGQFKSWRDDADAALKAAEDLAKKAGGQQSMLFESNQKLMEAAAGKSSANLPGGGGGLKVDPGKVKALWEELKHKTLEAQRSGYTAEESLAVEHNQIMAKAMKDGALSSQFKHKTLLDITAWYTAASGKLWREHAAEILKVMAENAVKEIETQTSLVQKLNEYKVGAGEMDEIDALKQKYELERQVQGVKLDSLATEMQSKHTVAELLGLLQEYKNIQDQISAAKTFEKYDIAKANQEMSKKAGEFYAQANQDSNGKYWQEETTFQLDALTLQYTEYNKYVTDKAALDEWYVNKAQEIQEKLLLGESVTAQKRALISQAEANIKGAAYKAMENQMLKLVETGKFSVGEMAQVIAQQVKMELIGLAARASVNALFYTGMGMASAASGNEASAALYFSAAGEMAAVGAATLAAAFAVNALTGPSSTSSPSGGSSYNSSSGNSNQNNGYRYFDYESSQYGTGWKPGEGQKQQVIYNINAVDAKSFRQMVKENPSAIHEVVQQDIKDNGKTRDVIQRYV